MTGKIKRRLRGNTVVANAISQDSKLSLKAKGLYLQLSSYPNNWSFTVAGILAHTSCKKASFYSAIEELEAAGLAYRESRRNDKVQVVGLDVWLTDKPFDFGEDFGETRIRKADVGKADSAFQPLIIPNSNHTYINTPQPPVENSEHEIQQAVALFNEAAEQAGWPRAQKLSKPRVAKLKARLKDCDGLSGWQAALAKASESDFLCARTQAAFTASFDFILQETSFTKLMEGNYDNRVAKSNSAAKPGPTGSHHRMLEGFAVEAGTDTGGFS